MLEPKTDSLPLSVFIDGLIFVSIIDFIHDIGFIGIVYCTTIFYFIISNALLPSFLVYQS